MHFIRKSVFALTIALPLTSLAMSFVPGDYYTSDGQSVNHFSTDGTKLESMSVESIGTDSRGIAFGPLSKLYVVGDNTFTSAGSGPATVSVFNARGKIVHSYTFDGWIGGLATAGNIRFSPHGRYFYVGAQDGVYRFQVGDTTGTKFISVQANDISVLANGDILVASEYSLSRYDRSGRLLATVPETINDPLGLTVGISAFGVDLTDVRGIEYDANTDTTFVTMLGYSGYQTDMNFKILALQGFSNTLKGIGDYWYGSEMASTGSGHLIVGSWAQAPGIFSISGNSPITMMQTGMFAGGSAPFVTVMAPKSGTGA